MNWRPALDLFDSPGPFLLTTHVNPDGDALGSELALFLWLTARKRPVRIVNCDPVPPRYSFLDPLGRCEAYDSRRHDHLAQEARGLVLLDVGRWDRLGDWGSALARSPARRLCVDHHPREGPVPADIEIIDPTAAATGELLFEMMEAAGDPIDREIATALYVAIMTDTGSFRHDNTTARTHRIAAELLRHPIATAEIFDQVYESSSETRMRLLGEALATMEVLAGGAVVVLTISRDVMARLNARLHDTEGFAEAARGVKGCEVAAVFIEHGPDEVKISLRSKRRVDVNRVARQFGGGGHPRAAGIPGRGRLGDLRESVVRALLRELDPDHPTPVY